LHKSTNFKRQIQKTFCDSC